MRNKDRIRPFCDRLAAAWERCPDMRFGQFICNVYADGMVKKDPFYVEDEDSIRLIESFAKEASPYREREYTVYAVDFDGTLCYSKYPGCGNPNVFLIDRLRMERLRGNKIILWTMREGQALQDAIKWCNDQGLFFDAVNDNLPELQEKWKNNPRKIYADYYIDDHNAGNGAMR